MWKLSFDCTPRPPFYWFPQCINEFNECEKCDLYCHCTCSISWLDRATLSLSVSKAQTSRAIVLLVCSIGSVIVSSKLETKPFMTFVCSGHTQTPQRPSVYAAVNVSVTVSHHFQFSSFLIFSTFQSWVTNCMLPYYNNKKGSQWLFDDDSVWTKPSPLMLVSALNTRI